MRLLAASVEKKAHANNDHEHAENGGANVDVYQIAAVLRLLLGHCNDTRTHTGTNIKEGFKRCLATGEQHLEWRHAPAAAGVAMKGKTKTKKRKFAPNFASLFPLILFRDKSELGPRTKQQRAGHKRRPGSTGLRSQRQQQHPKNKNKKGC